MSVLRRLSLLAACVAALGALAAPARAGVLVADAGDCEEQVLEQPFLPWLDPFWYTLVPDGTFEAGASGWALDAAGTVAGNEPWYVHAAGESTSLRIGPGGSATSPAMCVGLEHPTLRFFARRSGGTVLSTLRVHVLFETAAGSVQSLAIGDVVGGSSWEPTLPMAVAANLLPLLPGEQTPVAFRFVPQGPSASWTIDDVYVDPSRRS